MMTYKIVIIGAGEIGSRHLQGLARIRIPVEIDVIDPNEHALVIARGRFDELEESEFVISVRFIKRLKDSSNCYDLAIVATNSDVRLDVLIELVNGKFCKNIILEKVLFQSLGQYDLAKDIIGTIGINCWVNHSRRLFPYYEELKKEMLMAGPASISIQGGDWGMACNALHYLDLICYLCDSDQIILNTDGLYNQVYPSKRTDHIEFQGAITGTIKKNSFYIYSGTEKYPTQINIATSEFNYGINEGPGVVRVSKRESSWEWSEISTRIVYFQSELTNIVAEDILLNQKCKLPRYETIAPLHCTFISELLMKWNNITGNNNKVLPVT